MKNRSLLIIAILFFSPVVWAGEWEYAKPEEELQYNPFKQEWTHEKPENELKYNAFTQEWTYEDPKSELKFNPLKQSDLKSLDPQRGGVEPLRPLPDIWDTDLETLD